jgi:hypothetical protein
MSVELEQASIQIFGKLARIRRIAGTAPFHKCSLSRREAVIPTFRRKRRPAGLAEKDHRSPGGPESRHHR